MSIERYEQNISKAVAKVAELLHDEKYKVCTDVEHLYSDKYFLAEYLCQLTIKSLSNVFKELDIDISDSNLSKDIKKHTFYLKFDREETGEYIREETKEIEGDKKDIIDIIGFSTISKKVVNKITTHLWKFTSKVTLKLYKDNEAIKTIKEIEESCILTTKVKQLPSNIPAHKVYNTLSLNIKSVFKYLQ